MRQRKQHHKGFCPKTGKRKYVDSLDVLLDHQRNPRAIRSYVCEFCHYHHATSKSLRGEEAA